MKTMMLMMGLLVSTAAFAAPGGRGGFEPGRQGDRIESRRGDERRGEFGRHGGFGRRGDDDRRGGFARRGGDRHEGRGHECGRFGRGFGHRR